MTENTKYISDCHKAEMKVVGDSFGEGTKHYECLECGKPCDPVLPENTRSSELDKILAEHWSDLRVVESGNPGTRSNAHKKAKRRIEALIASKVEEARAECLCKDVDFQTYQHVVSMRPPFECEWEKTSKKNGREFIGIPIDICIATEIAELWHQGVVTLNSCCGHRKVRASVVVSDSEHEKLEQLGYTDWEVCPSGLRQYFLRTGALQSKEGDS